MSRGKLSKMRRIPGSLTGKDNPSPTEDLARGGDQSDFLRSATSDEPVIEGMQRIVAAHPSQSPHIKQTTHFRIAHLGNSRTTMNRGTALVRLRVKPSKSGNAFAVSLARGESLPAMEKNQQGQHVAHANPGQRQQALAILLEVS